MCCIITTSYECGNATHHWAYCNDAGWNDDGSWKHCENWGEKNDPYQEGMCPYIWCWYCLLRHMQGQAGANAHNNTQQ